MASKFPLYSSYSVLGWRVVRQITFDQGEKGIVTGALKPLSDALGNFHGYQLVDDFSDASFPSVETAGALRAAEAAAIAGLLGTSATKELGEDKRIERVKDFGLPAEDFIELAEVKVRLQTSSSNHGGDKALRVYPKTLEVKRAQGASDVSAGSKPNPKT